MAGYDELISKASKHSSAAVRLDSNGAKREAVAEYEGGIRTLDTILEKYPDSKPHNLFVWRREMYIWCIGVLRAQSV